MKIITPISAIDPGTPLPEFVDSKGLRALFGISRAQGYELTNQGKIRSVCLRKPGALRGKRLWDCVSVRALLKAL